MAAKFTAMTKVQATISENPYSKFRNASEQYFSNALMSIIFHITVDTRYVRQMDMNIRITEALP